MMNPLPYGLMAILIMLLETVPITESYGEFLEDDDDISPLMYPLEPPEITMCRVGPNDDCPDGQCCVKEVISFHDVDGDMEVRTRCMTYRTVGEFCLKKSEGYLCDCAKGLQCAFKNNETYGHCVQILEEKEENQIT